MPETPADKKKMINRLKRAEGQLRGIQKMIADDKACADVMTQLSAVRSSIDRAMGLVVAQNLRNCFENPDADPNDQSKKLDEAINMVIKK
ncbi:metal-sensitive transcriptional regulator [Agrilactobacillus yilanensis]|uniref:Metal-sensitive transcriptional regulator n=1 Tax=Agrilactobacillus yilanensis TaxID=2485997 RepID=A0ABW4J2M0_9LACO|nr:metal-sensitive transcriptional regulator [Agrilactobacillus yilanensis]